MNVFCVGVSHHTAPVEVRERLAPPEPAVKAALARIDCGHQAGMGQVRELAILSTCNRLELYAAGHEVDFDSLIDLVAETSGTPREAFAPSLYSLAGAEAAMHLCSVAAGLDSLVLGEPQILGQVVTAYELARGQGSAGTVLSTLFRCAIHAGKRARTETGISRNPASISSVAVKLAVEAVADLAGAHILVLGAGEMAKLAVEALRVRGAQAITVLNRTHERAAELAGRWQAQTLTFEHLVPALAAADIVIASTGAPHVLVNVDHAREAMGARPQRPLVFVDIAVPRNVDPEVSRLPGVYYHDIDDLEAGLNDGLAGRGRERPRVEAIVAEEADAFSAWLARLDIAPLIAELRAKAEAIRRAEVEKTLRHLQHLPENERQHIDALAAALVNKLLHEPTQRLKAVAANGHAADYASTVRDLFALNLEP